MNKKIILVPLKYEYLTYELDGTVDEVIARLKEYKGRLQVEGTTLVLSYETVYDYEGPDRQVVNLYLKRLETDEEYQARINEEQDIKERQLASKRAEFERLKKELGEG